MSWFVEYPVVMVEKEKIGALGEVVIGRAPGIKPMHGGLNFGGFNPAPDYGDEYYAEEEEPSLDGSSKKY